MQEIDKEKTAYWLEKAETSARGQRAYAYFNEGYNCSQAVAMAFSDVLDMSEELLVRAMSSFGGGMGRLREVCGAVSGMFFVAGALYGYGEPGTAGQDEKAAHYARIQQLADEYRSVNGSIICRELLGLSKPGADQPTPELRNEQYYKKRPCGQLCMLAAAMLEHYMEEHDEK